MFAQWKLSSVVRLQRFPTVAEPEISIKIRASNLCIPRSIIAFYLMKSKTAIEFFGDCSMKYLASGLPNIGNLQHGPQIIHTNFLLSIHR
jgi:hypothetical protein